MDPALACSVFTIFNDGANDVTSSKAWDTVLTAVERKHLRADVRHEEGLTLLHCAAIRCTAATVRRLLDAGVPPSVADDRGNTPMHLAATSRKDALQKCQLLPVADLACPNAAGDTPLHLVAEDTERHETFYAAMAHVPAQVPDLQAIFLPGPDRWSVLRWMVTQEECPLTTINHAGATALDLLICDACAAPRAIVEAVAGQRARWSPARATWTGAVAGSVKRP
jgi:ankyrin repeat protein